MAGGTSALSQQPNLELLEAVMFAVYGVEGTSQPHANDGTWRKRVLADALEFEISEFDEDRGTVARRNERIRQEDRCVFRREYRKDVETLDDPPKPVSRISNFETLNLREASQFEFKDQRGVPMIIFEGPSVHCGGGCRNSWNQMVGDLPPDRSWLKREIVRRKKAIEFIKQFCPGKPY
jgi:hypothetical protein